MKRCKWRECRKRFKPQSHAQAFCSDRCRMDNDNARDRAWAKSHPAMAKETSQRRYLRMRRDPERWEAYKKYHRDYHAVRMANDPAFRKRRAKQERLSVLRHRIKKMGIDLITLRLKV